MDASSQRISHCFFWLRIAHANNYRRSLLYQSTLCLAQALFGRAHNLPDLVIQAESSYGQILHTLQETIRNNDVVFQRHILWEMVAAFVFETLVASSSTWTVHARGVADLVKVLKPHSLLSWTFPIDGSQDLQQDMRWWRQIPRDGQ
jgi:hypothetical protein